VSDTGRPEQKLWKNDFVPSLLLSFVTTTYQYDPYIHFECLFSSVFIV